MDNKEYILVTGASSGMGREIAIKLSEYNNIILNGRDLERLEETKNHCSSSHTHLIWQYDLFNVEDVEQSLIEFLKVNDIKVNKFVHCAGFMSTYPLKMVNLSLIQKTFNVNVFSALLITKVLSNKKVNEKSLSAVVLISSNISNFGAKAFSAYGASKGALDSMMRSLAVELAPNVRVNSVLPGGVRTTMTEHMYQDEELISRMASSYPLGLGDVTDIYEVVNFLLSEKAKWITGQQITVDGGRTINISG
ncbi:MAG: SDR family oxidoreductase [Bacteroidales bacterium]|jgi:NAD(P)-dependent dehydrogenase (short-subunit alcohol dehydrogenase family)|nr:SDR family oxidoreductase [Bacteroidales bacterium]